MTLLSIVLPVYQVQGYLTQCLDSILGQGFADLEVIAVDDHSPDHCGEILDEYAARYPQVKVVHLPENVGLGEARNAGAAVATGTYVWFVDSDDSLTPGSLDAIAEQLREHAPEMLIIDFEWIYPVGPPAPSELAKVLRSAPGPAEFDILTRPGAIRIPHYAWNRIVRRELLEKEGLRFYPGWYEDVAWTFPLMAVARRIRVLERVCYRYYQRRVGAITKTVGDRHFEQFDQWEHVWRQLDERGAAADPYRPWIFRRMIWHFLLVAGNDRRLPPARRRAFFHRANELYRRYLPPGGYPQPKGVQRLKHAMIAHDAWWAFISLRAARRTAGRVRSLATLRPGAGLRRLLSKPGELPGRLYYWCQRRLPLDERLAAYAAYWYRGVSCNPAAVFEAAKRLAPDVKGVWIVAPESVPTLPSGTPHVVAGSLAYYRLLARATYLINNVNFPDFVVKRAGQVHLQTQHGTPIKAMGVDEQRYPAGAGADYAALLRRSDRWDYVLSSNVHSTGVWERSFPCRYEVLELGSPRNDRLVRAGAAEVAQARATLGISPDETVALYLPTRRSGVGPPPPFDAAAVAEALGPRGRVLVRRHYLDRDSSGSAALPPSERVTDLTGYGSIEDLYLAADLLISDYSSAIVDYAVLDRPIVLYVPDWAAYRAERGVVYDIVAQPPGPVAADHEELLALLRSGDYRDHSDRRAALRARFCPWENGHVSESVVRRVILRETGATVAETLLHEHGTFTR